MKHYCCICSATVCTMLFTVMVAAGQDAPALDEVASLMESEGLDRSLDLPDPVPAASDMRAKVAWTLLASGSDSAALRQFARIAGRQPTAVMPKIGYSLSAAGMGDLSNAARAMRRVLRVDPDALREVELEYRLRLRLETMRTDYLRRLAQFDHDRDGAIMLAALCYLLREDETARHAIRYLKGAGANGPETKNMERLILELTQPVVEEIVIEDDPEAPGERHEPLDFTLVFERVEPMPDETAALPEPVASAPVIEPQQTTSDELDVLDEPLDFTLVFQSVQPIPEEILVTPAVTGRAGPATADAVVVAAVTPEADPWAPARAQTIKGDAMPVVIEAVPGSGGSTKTARPQTMPAAPATVSDAGPATEAPVRVMPERVPVDYDKLRESLGEVGGALDSFTEKLIRMISDTRQQTGSSAP